MSPLPVARQAPWAVAALLLALAGCTAPLPKAGDLGSACTANADCASPFTCVDAKCVVSAPAGGCDPGIKRCNGGDVEVCAASGDSWAKSQACQYGCVSGACQQAVCAANTMRCNGPALEACSPSGDGWLLVQYCQNGCDAGGKKCQAPAAACTAGVRRCQEGAVEQCLPDQTGWGFVNFCEYGCAKAGEARCEPPPEKPAPTPACTAQDTRCNGSALEQCTPDGMAWAFVQFCSTGCQPKNQSVPAQCAPQVCRPFQTSCDPADTTGQTLLTCNSTGTGVDQTSCSVDSQHPGVCEAGGCRAVICSPGGKRCGANDTVETCNARGTGWTTTASCDHSCADGACQGPACHAGDRRCNGTAIEQCTPDETGYAFVQYCATGCTGSAPQVSCALPVCAPLARRCGGDGNKAVQVCAGDGSAWVTTETCSDACQNAACVSAVHLCNPGDLRCNGQDVQKCAADGLSWQPSQTCLGSCSAGTCDQAGACAGSLDDTGAFTSGISLTSPRTSVPADGLSSTLVVSRIVTDVLGRSVPDGTLFTVSVSSGAILSADADPNTAGIQVRAQGGKVHFLVRAAAQTGTGTVRIQAAAGPGCNGTLALTYAAPGKTFVTAEDFSSPVRKDAVVSTAPWYTDYGYVDGSLPLDFGTGRDGDLTVPTGTTWDLTASRRPNRSQPDAVNFQVLSLGLDTAVVDGFVDGLSPGDEVVLIDLQGSNGQFNNVGNYELLSVRSVQANGTIGFTQPIQKLYGNTTNNADLSNQRVMLQRVPHFQNVTLPATAGTVLTSAAFNGQVGGLLYMKVRGTLTVGANARIDMSGRGYRGTTGYSSGESYPGPWGSVNSVANGGGGAANGGCGGGGASYGSAGQASSYSGASPGNTYGSNSLGRLFLGSSGGLYCGGTSGAGGGIIAVLGATLTVAGQINDDGLTSSSWGGGGSGGSIFLRGANVTLGANLVTARGGTSGVGYNGAGGTGRIRVDSLTNPGTTTPSFYAGYSQRPAVQSLRVNTTADAQTIVSARLVAVVAQTDGGTVDYAISGDGGTSFAPATAGTVVNFVSGLPGSNQTAQGHDLRWRALFTPTSSDPLRLSGVVWEYTIQ